MCSMGKLGSYPALLPYSKVSSPSAAVSMVANCCEPTSQVVSPVVVCHDPMDSDLVSLKIGLLGDKEIGKTSFLVSIFFFFVGHQTVSEIPIYPESQITFSS